jgi:hypothetical protein
MASVRKWKQKLGSGRVTSVCAPQFPLWCVYVLLVWRVRGGACKFPSPWHKSSRWLLFLELLWHQELLVFPIFSSTCSFFRLSFARCETFLIVRVTTSILLAVSWGWLITFWLTKRMNDLIVILQVYRTVLPTPISAQCLITVVLWDQVEGGFALLMNKLAFISICFRWGGEMRRLPVPYSLFQHLCTWQHTDGHRSSFYVPSNSVTLRLIKQYISPERRTLSSFQYWYVSWCLSSVKRDGKVVSVLE